VSEIGDFLLKVSKEFIPDYSKGILRAVARKIHFEFRIADFEMRAKAAGFHR
jgi:hypothetical protein